MQETLLKEYAKLEEKFKSLETERKELREAILSDMTKHKMDKVESNYGMFTVAARAVWTYSPAIKKLADKLSLAKAKEQKSGKAKAETETKYIVFTPVSE